jgi:ADP-ribosylglycohydrolase
MSTNFTDRERILGCWLGKSIGGTLGGPYEGSAGMHALTFYNPVPTRMLPNDDLDLQVLWACKLATDWHGVVSLKNFGEAWLNNVEFPWDEYGVAIRNLRLGIPAPYSGIYDNAFTDGEGAAIRSELWAVLAPRNPALAAKMARMDGCVDHDGPGIDAICFLAALESEAFSGNTDIKALINVALKYIPADGKLAGAINFALKTVEALGAAATPKVLWEEIMTRYATSNFTDVCMNTAFEVVALLLGEGDFEKTICTAVNFAQDADCTGATTGSIMGIINPAGIPERWLAPIGQNMVISKEITGINPPADLTGFTDMILELRNKITIDDTIPPKPDMTQFEIPAERSFFAPWYAADLENYYPKFDEEHKDLVKLPGNLFTVDFKDVPDNTLVFYRVKFNLEKEQEVHIVVNTTAHSRVWIDGEFAFGRDGGEMLPAFHRSQFNQIARPTLKAGQHTLTFGLAPYGWNREKERDQVFFGVGCKDNQWLATAFRE